MNITGIEILHKHPDFPGIKWVLKARDKEDRRLIMRNILFDSNKWVATDGHRIHIYESQELYQKGLYESIVNNSGKLVLKFVSDDIDKYPKWSTIPCSSKTPLELKIDSGFYFSIAYSKVIRCLEVSVTLDFQFVQDLLKQTIDPWTVYIYEKADPVYFVSERKIGIIMPMHCWGE
ncbi:hypothetical protein KA005_14450 [bacterium]|nr:hypothetical protein [bacterium]